ncbi:MAG: hypothetical protein O7F74_05095 [Bacteroidetes bacterium]|nr:hypothetical protein [Bacteroidota bacterium]
MLINKHFQKLTIIIGILVAIIIGISFSGIASSRDETAQSPFSIIFTKSESQEFSKVKVNASKIFRKMIEKIN